VSSPAVSPDWSAIARMPQFRELVDRRRRFVVAGTLFYTLYFVAYLALLAFAPDLMAKTGSPSSLTFPGVVTIPLGFLGCWLGNALSRAEERTERSFDELLVRSETGLGSEGGPELGRRSRRFRRAEGPAPVR
jgi:cation/acetate symporter